MAETDDITANYHGGNLRSIEAHDSVRATKGRQRELVFRFIQDRGADGATCDEAERVMGISHQACSARFTELKAAKQIITIGKRPTRSGRNADVFIATRSGRNADVFIATENGRTSSSPRKMKHQTRIVILDKSQKCLGGTVVEDAIWRLIGNSFCLDIEVNITVIDTGIPYFCEVKDDSKGVPIFFRVKGSTTKLSPGDTMTFSRHDLTLDFGPPLSVVTPD